MKHKLCVWLATLLALCLCLPFAGCADVSAENEGGGGTTPHTHTFAAGWSHDEEKHWHAATCGHDTQRSGEAAHTYVNGKCSECQYEHEAHVYGAYEKTESGHSQTCTVCGKVVTDTHHYANGVCEDCEYEHQNHDYGACEKTETGHTGTCSVCGKTVTGQHNYENGKCTECQYEHAAHVYGAYDKTESGHSQTCTVCGKVVTDTHHYVNGVCEDCTYEHQNHNYGAYDKTESGHSQTCSDCGKVVTGQHNYENGKCTTCEYEHTSHTFTYSNKTETGHTGTCSVCGKTVTEDHDYTDGTCTECEYTHASHTYVYSEKTETEHTGTCSVCGKSVTEEHDYTDGTCTECNYEHASHTYVYSEKTETEHAGACSVCGKVVSAERHSYEKGVCKTCGYAHKNHTFTDNTCTVCGAGFYTESEDGTKIYFGSYPQTEVTDESDSDMSLRNSLNMDAGVPSAGSPGKWTDYGYYTEGAVSEYMWYLDVVYQGSRYRGVYFTSYRPYLTTGSPSEGSHQSKNGYNTNTAYWYKYEPIEWRILEQKDGKALLMANIILDSQQYYHTDSGTRTVDGKTVYPSDYKESDIRAWLNGTFLDTAFDELSKRIIETTTVDYSTKDSGSVSLNTQDKVFLLSRQEISNTSYGFSSSDSYDEARQLKSTDYAKVQGVLVYRDDSRYLGNCLWWTRSIPNANSAYIVNDVGDAYYRTDVTAQSCGGVVPALWIKL